MRKVSVASQVSFYTFSSFAFFFFFLVIVLSLFTYWKLYFFSKVVEG